LTCDSPRSHLLPRLFPTASAFAAGLLFGLERGRRCILSIPLLAFGGRNPNFLSAFLSVHARSSGARRHASRRRSRSLFFPFRFLLSILSISSPYRRLGSGPFLDTFLVFFFRSIRNDARRGFGYLSALLLFFFFIFPQENFYFSAACARCLASLAPSPLFPPLPYASKKTRGQFPVSLSPPPEEKKRAVETRLRSFPPLKSLLSFGFSFPLRASGSFTWRS